MFEAGEGGVALKHLLQQAQTGAGGGDGELGVQRDDYQVSHAVRLDLRPHSRAPSAARCLQRDALALAVTPEATVHSKITKGALIDQPGTCIPKIHAGLGGL